MNAPHSEFVFVESVTDKYNSPPDLIIGGHLFGNLDFGPRDPQRLADARLPLPPEFAGAGIEKQMRSAGLDWEVAKCPDHEVDAIVDTRRPGSLSLRTRRAAFADDVGNIALAGPAA